MMDSISVKLAVAQAIAKLVTDEDIAAGTVIPSPFNEQVAEESAFAAATAAVASGIALKPLEGTALRERIRKQLGRAD